MNLWGIWWLGWTRPSDQKVPSWNLIISTVSRLKFKLCAAVRRPSGQGLTESPVIRNASYYHNPKSYLNSSLMWLWFPRIICCYCSSAQMRVGAANQSCLLLVPVRRMEAPKTYFTGHKYKFTPNKLSFFSPVWTRSSLILEKSSALSLTRVWTLETHTNYNFNSTENTKTQFDFCFWKGASVKYEVMVIWHPTPRNVLV